MANKVIIETDMKELKSGQKQIETFRKSLSDTSRTVKEFNKNKAIMEMDLNDERFITSLEKNREKIEAVTRNKFEVMPSLQDNAGEIVNRMAARMEAFASKTYYFKTSADIGGTLDNISRIENKIESLSRETWNVDVALNTVADDKLPQLISQTGYSAPVESAENTFDGWKTSFKENPVETAFVATMSVAEIIGNFKTLKEAFNKSSDWYSEKMKKRAERASRLPDRFEDVSTGESLLEKVKGKERDANGKFSIKTEAKNFISSGRSKVTNTLKNLTGSESKIGTAGKWLKNTGTSALQKLTGFSNGVGNAAGKKVLTGGLAGKLGTAAAAGGKTGLAVGATGATLLSAAGLTGAVMTGKGIYDGTKHLIKGFNADNEYDKKYEKARGATTLGATAAGAAIGTAIFPGLGTLIGGGAGFLIDKFAGKKVAEKVAGGSDAAAEYASKSENAASKVADEKIPILEKFEERLAAIQNPEERNKEISGFVDKMNETTTALTTLAEKNLEEGKAVPEKVLNYLNAMDTYQQMLNQGNPANNYGNQTTGGYVNPNVPQIYNQEASVPGTNAQKGMDGLAAPLELILSGEKKVKDKIEVSAKDFLTKDNVQAMVRVDIGVIPQVTTVVTGGSKMKGNRSKKFRGGIVGGNVSGFAEGGYVQGGAQLITVAEEGTPEAIIPLGRHRRDRAMELFNQVGSYLQAPGFSPKGFAAGGIVGGSIGSGFGGGTGGGSALIDTCNVEINIEAKDGQTLIETIRDHREEISEEVAGVFNAAFKGQFANTPATGSI